MTYTFKTLDLQSDESVTVILDDEEIHLGLSAESVVLTHAEVRALVKVLRKMLEELG